MVVHKTEPKSIAPVEFNLAEFGYLIRYQPLWAAIKIAYGTKYYEAAVGKIFKMQASREGPMVFMIFF